MLHAYQPEAEDRRRISLLYERSGIEYRHSVIPDFTAATGARTFFPDTADLEPFPDLEQRLELYDSSATALSVQAIEACLQGQAQAADITSLITVSCTGMSAPGLDIGIMQAMRLPTDIQRSSVNFMGCYAAIHALKLADNACRADPKAIVMIVCTELCTLHFQKHCEMDSVASGLLFADGSAAVLVTGDEVDRPGMTLSSFYSEVALQGKQDMAWNLSGRGFLMRLSAYIPQLLQAGIEPLLRKALAAGGHQRKDITHWAIHPGGKKILETIGRELQLSNDDLQPSYDTLRQHGNMSSPTILFVLKDIMTRLKTSGEKIFAAAFGPGLTMETLILTR